MKSKISIFNSYVIIKISFMIHDLFHFKFTKRFLLEKVNTSNVYIMQEHIIL